jgi:hypothetical protein
LQGDVWVVGCGGAGDEADFRGEGFLGKNSIDVYVGCVLRNVFTFEFGLDEIGAVKGCIQLVYTIDVITNPYVKVLCSIW